LDRLDASRQELFRVINSAAGRVVLRPFLPAEIVEGDLPQLFSLAESVRDISDDRDSIGAAFARLRACVTTIQNRLDALPTVYGRRILLGTAEGLCDAGKRRLELRSPPARIEFRVSDRPLPLLEPGVTCGLLLTVLNVGDAPALGVDLTISSETAQVAIAQGGHQIGRLEAQSRQEVIVDLVIAEPVVTASLKLEANWSNLDHSLGHTETTALAEAHEVHIDWPNLEAVEPFAPYPVEQPEFLVAREPQLAVLAGSFHKRPLANLYVTGQRRVGKTSLVRVLMNQLATDPNLVVASVEMGEVRAAGGSATIAQLGRRLAEKSIRTAGLAGEVSCPDFSDTLAPLSLVVEQIQAWDEALSFVFVIDEFDELPQETYRRDGPGDALFIPMRSLAQKPDVGWLLVGGEKMPFIRDEQAARLNTFREIKVDYLPFGGQRGDSGFPGLVRDPLPEGFVVDEAAIRTIHDESAGNPHFAKEICAGIFARAVARRDALVSVADVQRAIDRTARDRDVELFAHFWEDGIFEVEGERRRRELHRRAYLAACAEVLRSSNNLADSRVASAAMERGLTAADITRLRTEFVRRDILSDANHGALRVKVPFFRRWLEGEGIYKLPPKGISEQIGQELATEEQRLRISSSEVGRLARRWREFTFRGQQVSRDAVETWLEQFDTAIERRLAFRLLERARLIGEAEIFSALRRLHRLVAHESQVRLKRNQRSLTHLYVSAIGGSGSSGESFAYTYRQANSVSGSNSVPIESLVDRLTGRHEVNTVVLIDDFIGSGGTALSALRPLADRVGELTARPPVHWFLFAVAGLPAGVTRVMESTFAVRLGLSVELGVAISEADLPLSQSSTVFPDEEDRLKARTMLSRYGERIGSRWPLGFGGQAVPVVFPENCPNNAPPVLWSDAKGWIPLFRRTGG
jgi:hypothetical protein